MSTPLPPADTGPWAPPRRRRRREAFLAIGVGVVALGAVFLALSVDPALFGVRGHGSSFPYAGGFAGLFLVIWGSLILVRVAFWSARAASYGRGGPGGRRWDPALVQARQRYARGEITREQFLQIREDLRPPNRPPP